MSGEGGREGRGIREGRERWSPIRVKKRGKIGERHNIEEVRKKQRWRKGVAGKT